MAILVNDAPAAELSNLCDIVRARRRVATRTKGFVTRKIDRREGTERIGPRPRPRKRGREKEIEIKVKEKWEKWWEKKRQISEMS